MKRQLDLTSNDLAMFLGGIALMRRYGDNQMHDWAGEMRDKLIELMNRPDVQSLDNIISPTGLMPVVEASEDKKEEDVTGEATKLLGLIASKQEPVTAKKATATAKKA